MFLLPASLPDRPAVLDSVTQNWWTYPELAERIAQEAAQVLARPRSLAFLFLHNDVDSLVAYLACQQAGHVTALLPGDMAAALREQLLATYQPEIVFEKKSQPAPGYKPLTGLYSVRNEAGTGELAPELAVLLSTSGSTGSPKFVRLSQASLLANARSIIAALGITAGERAIAYLPMSYSYGLSVVHTHLLAGASMVLTNESMLAAGFWELVRQHACTSFSGVPYSYQLLQRLDPDKLNIPSVRTMTQAGGKLDDRRIQWFHERMQSRGGRFFVMYGQTEAAARISVLPADVLPEKLGSVGLPIAGGQCHLEEEGRVVTGPGVTGELIYEGPNVMLGYAETRQDLAAGDTMNGRLPTGDLAAIDEDGFITIQGRSKRDAKIFGLRVNLDEIEGLMKPHGPTGVVAHASTIHIFCEYGSETEFQQWRLELASQLRIHHNAFAFHHTDRLPVQPSGKTNYQALLERLS